MNKKVLKHIINGLLSKASFKMPFSFENGYRAKLLDAEIEAYEFNEVNHFIKHCKKEQRNLLQNKYDEDEDEDSPITHFANQNQGRIEAYSDLIVELEKYWKKLEFTQ